MPDGETSEWLREQEQSAISPTEATAQHARPPTGASHQPPANLPQGAVTEEHYPQQQPTPSRATDPNLAHATAGKGHGEGVSGRRVEPSGQGGEAISSSPENSPSPKARPPGPTFTPRSVRLPGSAPTPRADRLRYAEEEGANRARTGTREMRHGRQEGTGAPPKW